MLPVYLIANDLINRIEQDFNLVYKIRRASLVAQRVRNPPAVQETLLRSLGQEDALEEGMTTHFSILA